jgi:hypothetical protein
MKKAAGPAKPKVPATIAGPMRGNVPTYSGDLQGPRPKRTHACFSLSPSSVDLRVNAAWTREMTHSQDEPWLNLDSIIDPGKDHLSDEVVVERARMLIGVVGLSW